MWFLAQEVGVSGGLAPRMLHTLKERACEAEKRWRRQDMPGHLRAPWVSASTFLQGFARRCESQCRHDWTALPIMRTVTFKYLVETSGGLTSMVFPRRRPGTTDTSAEDLIKDAQTLYDKLWRGYQRSGNLRIPIAGDTTRLEHAEGLTSRQRQMARLQKFRAEHFPGTQPLRRLMAHCNTGARIVYGDCLFLTISPNEQHSAFVLRLTRYRKTIHF